MLFLFVGIWFGFCVSIAFRWTDFIEQPTFGGAAFIFLAPVIVPLIFISLIIISLWES